MTSVLKSAVVPTESPTLSLSQEQVRQFQLDGFLVVRQLLPRGPRAQLLKRFALVVDRLAHQWVELGYVDDPMSDLPLTERYLELLRRSDAPVPAAWRRVLVGPEVYSLWRRPEMLGVIRSLIGEEVYAHGVWNGRPRDPFGRSKQVQWHQDAHYYKGWAPEQSTFVSAWIPLVPVDGDSACLQFVRASHQAGWLSRHRLQDGEYGVSHDVVPAEDVVTCAMEPGDVVFFTDTTIHRSTPNLGNGVRWSIDIRFARAIPEVVSRTPTGFYCSSRDHGKVETFETWAGRYDYEPASLLQELTNFEEGYDVDTLRKFSDVSSYSQMY